MARDIIFSSSFKKDYKLAIKRNKKLEKLDQVIELLANDIGLPATYKDHALTGLDGVRECHIEPDWLLVYEKAKDELRLIRTGSHSDIF